MSTEELKKEIIQLVQQSSDEELLENILDLLNFSAEGPYKMSEEEIAAVEEGLKDVEEGRVYTDEEANEMMEKWLDKKSRGLNEH